MGHAATSLGYLDALGTTHFPRSRKPTRYTSGVDGTAWTDAPGGVGGGLGHPTGTAQTIATAWAVSELIAFRGLRRPPPVPPSPKTEIRLGFPERLVAK